MAFNWEAYPEAIEILIEETQKKHRHWHDVAHKLSQKYNTPFNSEQCRSYARYLNTSNFIDRGGEFQVEQTTRIPRVTDQDLWEQYELITADNIDKEKEDKFYTVRLPKNEPYHIVIAGDQHVGDGHTDHARMREDQELIAATPNTLQIWAGDSIDNHIKIIAAMINSASSPSKQIRLLNYLIGIAGHKILAVIGGNHDFWTKQYAGLDYLHKFFNEWDIKFHNHRLYLTILLGGIEYKFGIYHQYRYNSSLNITHTVKRFWEQGEFDFDVGVVAHHHEYAIEPFRRHGLERWAIRPGSYQVNSEYSAQKGFNDAQPACPGVTIYPSERRIVGFKDFREVI